MPTTGADIESNLKKAFSEITHLEVKDTSSGCGSSFALVIVSPDFNGKGTLARHRLVNQVLKEKIASLHAFSQETYTPEQWEAIKAKKASARNEAGSTSTASST